MRQSRCFAKGLKLNHLAAQLWISLGTPPLFADVLAICGNGLAKLGGKSFVFPEHLHVDVGYKWWIREVNERSN